MPRASLSQTITQKTVLSQQLRQSVELLQLSGPELQRELEVQLLSNPLLKLDEEPEAEDVLFWLWERYFILNQVQKPARLSKQHIHFSHQ